MLTLILENFAKYFPELEFALSGGILIFARLVGFMRFAPLFNRKEIPTPVKLAFALIITVFITMLIKPPTSPEDTALVYAIVLNFVFGGILGWIGQCILAAIEAGGDMINMQMGLQAANVLDPTTQAQSSLVGRCFSMIGLIVFIEIGGVYWVLSAFIRSFTVFPLYNQGFSLMSIANIEYITQLGANVLNMGLQIAAPILLATLGQDIILGIISKTAPQVNVFQLSFLFKPVMGAAILVWILPMLMNIINDYYLSYAQIF